MASSGGGSPVWLTVIVARLAGGFAAGIAGFFVFASVASQPATFGPGTSSLHFSPWLLFAPVAFGALATGIAIHLLLPRMSGMNVGVFQAIVAAASGALFSTVVTLLFSHSLLTGGGSSLTSGSSTSLALLGGTTVVVSIFNWILAIAITTWMVTGAATGMEMRHGKEVTSQHSWSPPDPGEPDQPDQY